MIQRVSGKPVSRLVGVCVFLCLAGQGVSSSYAQTETVPEATEPVPAVAEPDEVGPEAVVVDPDFAAAIEADAKESKPTQGQPMAVLSNSAMASKQSMNPDISFVLTTGAGGFLNGNPINQGGHAINHNGFVLQGLEFGASASVDPYFRYDMKFELAHGHLEEATFTTLALPGGLQARGGYFFAKFGRQNDQCLHLWNFVSPALSHSRFLDQEHLSGAGMEWSLLLPLPWYSLVLVEMMSTDAGAGFRSASFGKANENKSGKADGFEDFLYVGRFENFFELSADWSMLLGGSTALGQSPHVQDNRAALFGGDLTFKWTPSSKSGAVWVKWTTEGVLRQTQVPLDANQDWGGYSQIDVQMARQWQMGVRGDYADMLSGPQFQCIDDEGKPTQECSAEDADFNLGGKQTRGSLSVTFLPTHFSKIRLQGDVLSSEDVGGVSYGGFLQVEVSAGAHAAHSF